MIFGEPPEAGLGGTFRLSHPQGKRRGEPRASTAGGTWGLGHTARPFKPTSNPPSRQSLVGEVSQGRPDLLWRVLGGGSPPGNAWSLGGQQVQLYQTKHFRLRTRASGPEIVDLWGRNACLLPQNSIEKVGGEAPPPFPMGFAVSGGRSNPKIDDFRPGGSVA